MSIVLDTKDFGEVKDVVDVKGNGVESLNEVASTVIGSSNTVGSGSKNNVGSLGYVGSLGNVDQQGGAVSMGSVGSGISGGSLNNVTEVRNLINLENASTSAVNIEAKPEEPVVYREYKYRYVIFILYFLISNAGGISGPLCVPIITNLTGIYGVSQTVVNLATLLGMILYIPASIPGNYILDNWGIKKGIIIGTALMLAGNWVRMLANQSFYFVLLGQALAAIGGPLLGNCPQKISAYWASPKSRTMFTTLLILSGALGGSIGFMLPSTILGDISTPEEGKPLFLRLIWIEALVSTALCAPVFFLFREKPPTPPSPSAVAKRENFKEGFKALMKNKNFLWLLGQQGCVLGSINAMATVLQSLIDPFGYTQVQASSLSVMIIVAAVVGCIVIGLYVQKTKQYKRPMIYSAIVSLALYGAVVGIFYAQSFAALSVTMIVLGFVLSPCGPIALELACEITFPVGEAMSGGLILCVIQIFCPVQTFIIGGIMEREDKRQGAFYSMIMLICFMCFGVFCSFRIKSDLRRSAHDKLHTHVKKVEEKGDENKNDNAETPCPLVEDVQASPKVNNQETGKPAGN